jgi:uncharacterized membrane-anchored protein YhcB (DUF1043 family)
MANTLIAWFSGIVVGIVIGMYLQRYSDNKNKLSIRSKTLSERRTKD